MKKIIFALFIVVGTYSFAQTNVFPIQGNVGIGTSTPGGRLNVVNVPQDSGGDTFILGNENTGANLRMGYNTN
ncbi:hypothetical protein FLA105534_00172 [Flavobacterium bizetiae]|uniref:Uncharacterized protein n=1 Tax=Flavobacterium bizetiae TaxID=2704140 RepID=A0A6J4G7Z0_9FLAO|nr:hypothetical protein [Flavobacterium bizetiae]CAA9194490.1 hypothetical protein FLA105534_00172 [Flavobacterium bizetiae]CAD5340117.1 hypothetical protein FLA105535_00071 [Flavobacterium bizetiae]CAD5346212.1 hypothetical protein FLA105534_00153 [Flavobacterium bizetiae]